MGLILLLVRRKNKSSTSALRHCMRHASAESLRSLRRAFRSCQQLITHLRLSMRSRHHEVAVEVQTRSVICRLGIMYAPVPKRSSQETFHSSSSKLIYTASLFPSLTSFSAFIVPCRACLWFLRNFGSVPFKDGYLCVFGFLILLFKY